jgi:hypothetical protein
MAAIDDLKKELANTLRYYGKGGKRGGRAVPIRTLPMVTDKVWRGIPLARAMSPPVPATGVETEHLFDSWLWPVKNEEGESVTELITEGGSVLARYVTKAEDFGERTVRLLYALSNADGASLVHDDHAIMVHHDTHSFGIIDGKVFSRFCDGVNVDVDHQRILTESKEVRVATREFCYLWNEAYSRKENLIDPLVALWQSATIVHWSKLATRQTTKIVPGQADMDKWLGHIENKADDPILYLYKMLVPKWMTKTAYNSVFGLPTERAFNPTDYERQIFMNKVCDWYNKKLKGGKA